MTTESIALPTAVPPPAATMTTGTQRAGMAAADRPARSAIRQRLRDYVTLTKPRIISLLLVTTLTPMMVAAGGWPDRPLLVLWTMLGGYLMAGGANTTNMFIDRDIDSRMTRTALRPVPSGRMSAGHALAFGILLMSSAFALFWFLVNPLSAWLALAGYVYYVFIYTLWLKRRTPHNIVIGGGAGAFPPLVGWTAVTGSLTPTAVALFLVVVLWTPPHFWALALVKQKEYGRVSVPMAPNAWGEAKTLRQMRGYAILLVALTMGIVLLGELGVVYLLAATALGGWFLRAVLALPTAGDRVTAAWSLYKGSLLYLALLFAAMGVDAVVRVG